MCIIKHAGGRGAPEKRKQLLHEDMRDKLNCLELQSFIRIKCAREARVSSDVKAVYRHVTHKLHKKKI